LLDQIATNGNGTFSFIPDAGFVGTIFVNALTIFSTIIASRITLSFETQDGAKIKTVFGGFPVESAKWGSIVHVGNISFGQTKDVVVEFENSKIEPNLTLKFNNQEVTLDSDKIVKVDQSDLLDVQLLRLAFVDAARKILVSKKLSGDYFEKEVVKKHPIKNPDKYAQDLLKDIQGEASLSLKETNFKKWGSHYLLSLLGAHLNQNCNNFKDPGVQHYGGEMFTKIRDVLDEAFLKIPPPKPSIVVSSSSYNSNQPINMNSYYDASGGCFDGNCVALMSNQEFIPLKNLKKGDLVSTPNGISKIVCVVKTVFPKNKAQLVELENGLISTPYHPIRKTSNSEWTFPKDMGISRERFCEAVYTFVLDSAHIMLINGYQCVTLGHNFKDNAVVSHPFFGSDSVIADLKRMNGWKNGFVTVSGVNRDKRTGLISSFVEI